MSEIYRIVNESNRTLKIMTDWGHIERSGDHYYIITTHEKVWIEYLTGYELEDVNGNIKGSEKNNKDLFEWLQYHTRRSLKKK